MFTVARSVDPVNPAVYLFNYFQFSSVQLHAPEADSFSDEQEYRTHGFMRG